MPVRIELIVDSDDAALALQDYFAQKDLALLGVSAQVLGQQQSAAMPPAPPAPPVRIKESRA